MVCKKCGSVISGLACAACLLERNLAELRRMQTRFIREVLDDMLPVRLAVRSGGSHLELFGDEDRAYCGADIREVRRRVRSKYSDDLRRGICEKCLAQFDAVVRRIDEEERERARV